VLGCRIPGEEESLKRTVGYMTQRFSLYEDLSVRENLEFIARVYAVARPRRRARIEELLESFVLADCARRRAGTLSGGEKQRLALAAAILHEPRLLFLDEPTSAVDPQSRREFWETLFQLAERGVTILVSTHYMDEAERCHRLGILDHGRLVADGAPQSLEAGVDATVLEIECADPRRAIALLAGRPDVISTAQLGMQLRVLLRRDVPDPVALVTTLLAGSGLASRSVAATPSLEDVFVAATHGHFRRRTQ
jgi:ABC-2 type transport system ATP-binding protein